MFDIRILAEFVMSIVVQHASNFQFTDAPPNSNFGMLGAMAPLISTRGGSQQLDARGRGLVPVSMPDTWSVSCIHVQLIALHVRFTVGGARDY